MRALVIGPKELANIKKVRAFAESHRIGVNEVLDIYNGQAKSVGDRFGFSCDIPVGYRLVFCIEYQKKGWARHLSVSIHPSKPGKCANPAAVQELMGHLGFVEKLEGGDIRAYFEQNDTVINVIEYIKEEGPGQESPAVEEN